IPAGKQCLFRGTARELDEHRAPLRPWAHGLLVQTANAVGKDMRIEDADATCLLRIGPTQLEGRIPHVEIRDIEELRVRIGERDLPALETQNPARQGEEVIDMTLEHGIRRRIRGRDDVAGVDLPTGVFGAKTGWDVDEEIELSAVKGTVGGTLQMQLHRVC